MIVNHLSSFFWDIDIDTFIPQLYPDYTIARLLEYGDLEAISWLKEQFAYSGPSWPSIPIEVGH